MEIFIARNGETLGPYPQEQVKEMVGNGMLLPMDLAWSEQTNEWRPLYKVAGIVPDAGGSRTATLRSGVVAPPSVLPSVPEPTVFPLAQKNDSGVTEEDIVLYAGFRNRHYVKAWRNYDAPSLFRRISGNIGFFAASFLWLFYRKLYRYGMIAAAIAITMTQVEKYDILPSPILVVVYAALVITYLLFSLYYVDRLYLEKAEEIILGIKSREKNRLQQKALIKEVGGTRPFLAITILLLICFLPSILNLSTQFVKGYRKSELQSSPNQSGGKNVSDNENTDLAPDTADLQMMAMLKDKLGYSNVTKLSGMPSRFFGRRTVLAAQSGNDPVMRFPPGTSPVFVVTAHNLGVDGHLGTIKSVFSGQKGNVQYFFAVGNDNKYSAFWAADANLRSAFPGADCTFQIVGNPAIKSILSEPIQP